MIFKEYLEKNKYVVENMDFESSDELKKFANEQKITYSAEELQQAWDYIKRQNAAGDGEELDDDALDEVAGGKGEKYVTIYKIENCGNEIGNTKITNDNRKDVQIGNVNGNTNIKS